MKMFIKVIAHISLFALYVLVFYFVTSLFGSSWTNWLWTIVTGLLLILNCFILYGICGSNDEEEQKQMSVVGDLLEALIAISLTCKIMTLQNEDIGFMLLPFAICLFFSGINKYVLSFSFLFGSIILFVHNIDFSSSWHCYVVFICLIITHLLTIFGLGYKRWKDEDLKLNRWGLLIIPTCVAYLYYFGELQLQSDFQLISILIYILLGFAISMPNNIMVYGLSPIIATLYGLLFMLEWHPLYSWLIVALSTVYGALFFFTFKSYKSYLEGLIIYIMREYTSLGENYKQLVGEYNKIVGEYNEIVGEYNEIVSYVNKGGHSVRRSDSGGYGREVSKGFWRGVGHWLAELALRSLR